MILLIKKTSKIKRKNAFKFCIFNKKRIKIHLIKHVKVMIFVNKKVINIKQKKKPTQMSILVTKNSLDLCENHNRKLYS